MTDVPIPEHLLDRSKERLEAIAEQPAHSRIRSFKLKTDDSEAISRLASVCALLTMRLAPALGEDVAQFVIREVQEIVDHLGEPDPEYQWVS